MKNKSFLILLILYSVFSFDIYSQNISGSVFGLVDNKKEALDAAVIKWINTKTGTITDEDGKFEISAEGITDKRVIVSYIGFSADTVNLENNTGVEILLIPNTATSEIIVKDKRGSTFIGSEVAKTETITSLELVKDACCDLSGCFGRNSSVEVAVTDILTDSKELKILGLEGAYTQILIDNVPLLSGLNVKYGVSSIPGTIIDKITVSKGSNSVLQGYESISGIMNVILKNQTNSDKFMLNGFMNSVLEKQVNLNYTEKLNKNLNTIFSFHSVQSSNRVDENNDGFLDNPLITRYTFYNKWDYSSKENKTDVNFAARYWNEDRTGGQTDYFQSNDEGSKSIYGQTAGINSLESYLRIGKKFSEDKNMKLYFNSSYYDQNSYYGITKYAADQFSFTGSGFYETALSGKSYIKAGISYKYLNINEDISFGDSTSKTYAGNYIKKESIPGIFMESSFNFLNDKASVMAGFRYDYHNEYKSVYTPRVLFRYQPVSELVIRTSAGTGFRTINLFNEHSNILASSKDIRITETLDPEKIFNFGADVIYYFNLGNSGGSLNLDYYRTEFNNKIIPDYDTDPSAVIFSNLDGKAYSNVFQSEFNITLFRLLDLKLAYKFVDLKYEKNGIMTDQPFNSKNRFFSTLSYTLADDSWGFNTGLQWFGTQRLPSTESNPLIYQRPLNSDPYTLINMQINRNFSNFEIYAGIDNLLDFMQENPIIAADDPFGPYFDTSYIWGPTMGREFYLGFRFKLN
ncbi:MAG: TonB-dependent receptor [Ignavibacteria bacterium]|nr:TonB-dependent receptor [Ignavibacteria bacterium]